MVLGPEHRVASPAVGQVDPTGTHLVLGAGGHLGTERRGQLLCSEAHAEHREVAADGGAEEVPLRGQPGVGVAVPDAHRATHDHQATEGIDRRHGIAPVEADHGHVDAGVVQGPGDRPGALVGHVLEDRPRASRRSGRGGGH